MQSHLTVLRYLQHHSSLPLNLETVCWRPYINSTNIMYCVVNMNSRPTTEKSRSYYNTCTNFVSRESICISISSQASHMHVNDKFIYCNTDTKISLTPFFFLQYILNNWML